MKTFEEVMDSMNNVNDSTFDVLSNDDLLRIICEQLFDGMIDILEAAVAEETDPEERQSQEIAVMIAQEAISVGYHRTKGMTQWSYQEEFDHLHATIRTLEAEIALLRTRQ